MARRPNTLWDAPPPPPESDPWNDYAPAPLTGAALKAAEWATRHPTEGRKFLMPGEREGRVIGQLWPGEREPRRPGKDRP